MDALGSTLRRVGCFYVEIEAIDVVSRVPFFGRKAGHTTKREAIEDMKEQASRGIKCRVTNAYRKVVAES